jgi:hypothetical protein
VQDPKPTRVWALSFFPCCLSANHIATSKEQGTKKKTGLTTPRSSKERPSPDSFDPIATEIEVHQLPALSQHPCKILCPGCSEIKIAAEIKVSQRWALRQHSCKPLCILSFHFTARQLDVLIRHWAGLSTL